MVNENYFICILDPTCLYVSVPTTRISIESHHSKPKNILNSLIVYCHLYEENKVEVKKTSWMSVLLTVIINRKLELS